MKIAIVGATGKAGHLILVEALKRSHQVTAIVRDAGKVKDQVAIIEKDVFDLTRHDLADFDVVVDAFGTSPDKAEQHKTTLAHLSEILAGQKARLLVVGGAGSLYVDDKLSIRLIDTPEFPEAYKATASNMGAAFDQLKKRDDVKWTYVSPSAFFNPEGARTGAYVLGKDQLLVNAAGDSTVSYADYAVAMIDEAEAGKHIRERITVGAK